MNVFYLRNFMHTGHISSDPNFYNLGMNIIQSEICYYSLIYRNKLESKNNFALLITETNYKI